MLLYTCIKFVYFRKISGCKTDMNELLPKVEACTHEINKNSKTIVEYQKQRQTAVWRLIEMVVS